MCPRTEVTLSLRKAKEAQDALNRREERALFCSINCEFSIFVLLCAIMLLSKVKYILSLQNQRLVRTVRYLSDIYLYL